MAPASLAVAAIRKKELGIAHGAAENIVDLAVGKPLRAELGARDGPQVHARPAAFGLPHDTGARRQGRKLGGDVRSDLESIDGDVWADGGDELCVGSRALAKLLDGCFEHTGDQAPPTRVRGSDQARTELAEEDRNAVGASHTARDAGARRHEPVAPELDDPIRIFRARDDRDLAPVYLR